MLFPFLASNGTSLRLRILQGCQLTLAAICLIFTVVAALHPGIRSKFLFALLYSWIGTSIINTTFIYKELAAAANDTLTRDKYAKYQMIKFFSALLVYVVGFVIFARTPYSPRAHKSVWIGDLLAGGHRLHATILWMHALNWLLLWTSMFYSCCMSDVKRAGQIRLAGDEAQISLGPEHIDEMSNDEAIARELQAQEPEWQA